MRTLKNMQGNLCIFFRHLLGTHKAMVAYYKHKSLKYLVIPSNLKGSDNSRFQASAYVAKQTGNEIEIDIKHKVDKIVKEEGVMENMSNRLNSTLALVGKEIGKKQIQQTSICKREEKILIWIYQNQFISELIFEIYKSFLSKHQ